MVGQVNNTYIVAEGPDGMYLVDQHTAHERVLFERVLKERSEKRVQVQGMLAPATVDLSPVQRESLAQVEELIRGHGFDVEPFGDGAYVLRAVPAMLSARAPDRAFPGRPGLTPRSRLPRAKRGAACCINSVPQRYTCRGRATTGVDGRVLCGCWSKRRAPTPVPHGRPTLVHLSSSLLEKEFGRR